MNPLQAPITPVKSIAPKPVLSPTGLDQVVKGVTLFITLLGTCLSSPLKSELLSLSAPHRRCGSPLSLR